MIRAVGELDCSSAHIRIREPGKSKDKTDAMGMATPWYLRGGTPVKSSIPCSHGRRTLVAKGAEKVENAEPNSKYQDNAEG
ncbi:hypothetical protein BHE74_00046470 [Ensete ventricosum]|nr:hypothetical protein BHE74_00046470 [Ensete ventricosum]